MNQFFKKAKANFLRQFSGPVLLTVYASIAFFYLIYWMMSELLPLRKVTAVYFSLGVILFFGFVRPLLFAYDPISKWWARLGLSDSDT